MPTTLKGTYRQRLRWARSWWWMLPYVFTRLSTKQTLSPAFGLMQLIVTPLMLSWIAVMVLVHGIHGRSLTVTVLYIATYVIVRYCTAAFYLIGRPNVTRRQKLVLWLIGTPASVLLNMILLMPTRYYALLKLRDNRWQTREVAAEPSPEIEHALVLSGSSR